MHDSGLGYRKISHKLNEMNITKSFLDELDAEMNFMKGGQDHVLRNTCFAMAVMTIGATALVLVMLQQPNHE